MAGNMKVALVLLVCALVGAAAPLAESAITCGQVTSNLAPCIGYLRGSAAAPVPGPCCNGIRTLNGAAKTTPDRQTACNCIKSASTTITGINYSLAAGLPSKCGVNIPYKISPSTDCKSVK